jgi:dual specificity tyrosine-phosphorylation-regulated kinase 2/3/4
MQILQSLSFLNNLNIIHSDIKPENILLKHDNRSGIKVIDFGSSCRGDETVYEYVQSRYYRAPEVILDRKYGVEVDMWSFGCVIAELYTGLPLFPGRDEREMVAMFVETLGEPQR